MEHQIADIQYCEYLFNQFYDIGSTESGGVTRLGYSKTEDRMHDTFAKLGSSLNLQSYQDQVGNTYLANSTQDGYYLIGSHLDSVVEGGRWRSRNHCRSDGYEMGNGRWPEAADQSWSIPL